MQDGSPMIPASDSKPKIVPDSTQSVGVSPDSTKKEGFFITEKDHLIPTPPSQSGELEPDSATQQKIPNLFSTNGLPLLTKTHEMNGM